MDERQMQQPSKNRSLDVTPCCCVFSQDDKRQQDSSVISVASSMGAIKSSSRGTTTAARGGGGGGHAHCSPPIKRVTRDPGGSDSNGLSSPVGEKGGNSAEGTTTSTSEQAAAVESLAVTADAAARHLAGNSSPGGSSGSRDNVNVRELEASAAAALEAPQPVEIPAGLPPPAPTPPTVEFPQPQSQSSSTSAPPSEESPLPPSELPLSPDDISKFEEDGFVMLKRAFDPEVAAACRESLWKRLQGEGVRRDDPSTWVSKISLAEIYGIPSAPKKRRGYPWNAVLSSTRLKSAINQLAGADAWEEFGCGWWMVTFPGFSQPPWGAEGKWHIDGAHFRHYPHSREIGLLPIFLFSDVRPHGGGTAVLRGSHKKVAKILWNRAGAKGLKGPAVSSAAREALLPAAASEDVIETTGSAGDVLLTHPLLLHARSTNLAPVEESGVRLMCHPAIPLKRHLDLHAPRDTYSVLERVMWCARPTHFREGQQLNVIPKPEECDHSPVKLPPFSNNKRYHQQAGGGKRGRRKKVHGQARAAGTEVCQNQQQQDDHQQQRQQQQQLPPQQPQPGTVGHCSDSEVTDHAMVGHQPDAAAGRPDAREDDTLNMPDSICAASDFGDECALNEAVEEESDAAVMAAMGFDGFGSSRG